MNFRRRLEALEKGLIGEPILLQMPDGRTETIPGRGDYVLDLICRACRGERTPEIELIAQSTSSIEPGGGHMLDLARSFFEWTKVTHTETVEHDVRVGERPASDEDY